MSESEPQSKFTTTTGIILSCLGTVVGTGNVWRFPRIVAENSRSQGNLGFILVWMCFLLLWSSPLLLIEYAMGRYFKKPPVQAFFHAMGKKFVWCGAWVSSTTFLIGCYYSVIVSWCYYYLGDSMYRSFSGYLLENETISRDTFDYFTESGWPVLFNGVNLLAACACVIGGITWIEKVNCVLVPSLLLIIVITYCWSVVQRFSDSGIRFLFGFDPEQLANPQMWIDAVTQNAFDTGAAMGLIMPYATYMTRRNGVVKYSILIPAMNNVVSLLCVITIFSTVFSTLIERDDTLSTTSIIEIMKKSGPASTGLTFIWIPVIFGRLEVVGRILCPLFFLCLCFAGLCTTIADVEHFSLTMSDFGIPRKLSTPLCGLVMFLIGLPSAISINILDNQDFIWGYALLLSGFMFQSLVLKVGYDFFKEKMINKYSENDWKLTHVHMFIILVVAPLEALTLLVWYFYEEISGSYEQDQGNKWYNLNRETLMTMLLGWALLLIVLILFNLALCKFTPKWMRPKDGGATGEDRGGGEWTEEDEEEAGHGMRAVENGRATNGRFNDGFSSSQPSIQEYKF